MIIIYLQRKLKNFPMHTILLLHAVEDAAKHLVQTKTQIQIHVDTNDTNYTNLNTKMNTIPFQGYAKSLFSLCIIHLLFGKRRIAM